MIKSVHKLKYHSHRIVSEVSHVKKFTHYTNGMEVMCVRAHGCSYVLV